MLPIVLCIDNYYIINHKEVLICGNRTIHVENVNWYESNNGVFKNMSTSSRRIMSDYCPAIYYCEYDEDYFHYSLKYMDLFVVKCNEAETYYHMIPKIADKISYNNLYLIIFLFIIFGFYFLASYLKKYYLNKKFLAVNI